MRRRRSRHHGGRLAAAPRAPPQPGARSPTAVGLALRQGSRPLVRGWEQAAVRGPRDSGWRPRASGNPLGAGRPRRVWRVRADRMCACAFLFGEVLEGGLMWAPRGEKQHLPRVVLLSLARVRETPCTVVSGGLKLSPVHQFLSFFFFLSLRQDFMCSQSSSWTPDPFPRIFGIAGVAGVGHHAWMTHWLHACGALQLAQLDQFH